MSKINHLDEETKGKITTGLISFGGLSALLIGMMLSNEIDNLKIQKPKIITKIKCDSQIYFYDDIKDSRLIKVEAYKDNFITEKLFICSPELCYNERTKKCVIKYTDIRTEETICGLEIGSKKLDTNQNSDKVIFTDLGNYSEYSNINYLALDYGITDEELLDDIDFINTNLNDKKSIREDKNKDTKKYTKHKFYNFTGQNNELKTK